MTMDLEPSTVIMIPVRRSSFRTLSFVVCILQIELCSLWIIRTVGLGDDRIDYTLFEDSLSWFDARQKCLDNGFDDLLDKPTSDLAYRGIAQLITDDVPNITLTTFWTYFHCPDPVAAEWYQSGCNVTQDITLTCKAPRQCVVVHYYSSYTIWEHEHQNCSTMQPFICKKYLGPQDFKAGNRTILHFPPSLSVTDVIANDKKGCKNQCDGLCVAWQFRYSSTSCKLFNFTNTDKVFAALNLSDSNYNGTTAGSRRAIQVFFEPASDSSSLPAPYEFPCSTETNMTTSLTTSMATTTTTHTTVTAYLTTTTTTPTTTTTTNGITTTHPTTTTHLTTAATYSTTTDQPTSINVLGFVDTRAHFDVYVFSQRVSWYNARAICKSDALYGSLALYRQVMGSYLKARIEDIVQNAGYTTTPYWTSLYSYNNYLYDGDCHKIGAKSTIDTCYYSSFQDVPYEAMKCGYFHSFVCMRRVSTLSAIQYTSDWSSQYTSDWSSLLKMTAYPGYDIEAAPNGTELVTMGNLQIASECEMACLAEIKCIGTTWVSMNYGGHSCTQIIISTNSFLRYNIVLYTGHNLVTHYVKTGIKSKFFDPNSQLPSVEFTNELPMCNVTSTTSSTVSTSIETMFTSTTAESSTGQASSPTTISSTLSESTKVSSATSAVSSSTILSSSPEPTPSTTELNADSSTITESISVQEIISTTASTVESSSSYEQSSETSTPKTQNCQCKPGSTFCFQKKYTPKTLDVVIEELTAKLRVDKKSTSLHKRRLVCAEDNRPSSTYIGTAAIVIISLYASVVVLPDILEAMRKLKRIARN